MFVAGGVRLAVSCGAFPALHLHIARRGAGVFVTEAVGGAHADRNVAAVKLMSISEERHEMLERGDIQALFSSAGIEPLDHMRFFCAFDVDGSGPVTIGEFILGFNTLAGQSKQMDLMIFHADMKTMMEALDEKHNHMTMPHAESDDERRETTSAVSGPSPTHAPIMRCLFQSSKCVVGICLWRSITLCVDTRPTYKRARTQEWRTDTRDTRCSAPVLKENIHRR